MTSKELITALRRLSVETGSLGCFGCGHEHNCGLRGCAILREAVSVLERQQWIPVAENPPPEDVRVLAKTNDGWIFIGRDFRPGDEIHDGPSGVQAWMPLPE